MTEAEHDRALADFEEAYQQLARVQSYISVIPYPAVRSEADACLCDIICASNRILYALYSKKLSRK